MRWTPRISNHYRTALKLDVEDKLIKSKDDILNAKENNGKIIIVEMVKVLE